MTEPLGWGLIGTGGIAQTFAADLMFTDSGRVAAVGSRHMDSADRFADRFSIPDRHASYEELVADPDVEVVYVATPHPMHHGDALLALRAGKPVLVEKPFTMNAAEAQELVATARAAGLFLMEAMWTRFLPHHRRDPPPARRGCAWGHRHGQRRPRAVVRARPRLSIVRARARRRRAAGLGRLSGFVCVDGARHSRPDRDPHRPGVHRCRRSNIDVVRVPEWRAGRPDLHALGQEPDPRGDRRYRRPHRDRRRLLCADIVHAHPTDGRANPFRRTA